MNESEIRVPAGFLFASATAGIKASGNADLGLIEAPDGASAGAVFTNNQVVAAPIIVGREHLKFSSTKVRAVLVNAGNANCATGKPGIAACEKSCLGLAKALRTKTRQIIPSSTGVIGVQLPVDKLIDGIPQLLRNRGGSAGHAIGFARAIMTTDTRPKIATATLELNGLSSNLLGIAKGAGMIHPNMATMLCYIVTDVMGSARQLDTLLSESVDQTFNRISIDGDTSTNDTVCLLASGKSELNLNKRTVRDAFAMSLYEICASLAKQIIADGEGVKHVVTLRIEGAKSEKEADVIARAIAHSPLVKTAWAGADPNWGRVLAAIGRSGVALDPSKIDIHFGEIAVCRRGTAVEFDEQAAHEYLSRPEFEILIRLGRGKRKLTFLTCDLTTDYVHINADYHT